MKQLRHTFTKFGETFTQVHKDDRCVIYRRGGDTFEVFRYRTAKTPPQWKCDDEICEVYPSSKDFGSWAWCCTTPGSLTKILKREFGWRESEISAFLGRCGQL